MKNVLDIYHQIIEPVRLYVFKEGMVYRKPTIKDYEQDSDRLITLIIGLIIGADLSGDKIDRLAKQIKKIK